MSTLQEHPRTKLELSGLKRFEREWVKTEKRLDGEMDLVYYHTRLSRAFEKRRFHALVITDGARRFTFTRVNASGELISENGTQVLLSKVVAPDMRIGIHDESQKHPYVIIKMPGSNETSPMTLFLGDIVA